MFITHLLRGLSNDVGRRIRCRRRPRRGGAPTGSAHRCHSRALVVETLEDRRLLTGFFVDTLLDTPSAGPDDKDGLISLREAITAANTDAPYGDAPAGQGGDVVDTITFDASLNGQTIVLGGMELAVSRDLSVTGPGATALTISGNQASGVFWIEPDATVDISHVTIADGAESYGAGIYNEGTLTLVGSVLTNNSADWEGGAIYNDAYYNDAATVTIIDTSISNNSADDGGAGVWNDGTLNITNSTFTDNKTLGYGGAIANFAGGTVAIAGSSFTGNEAGSQGGAIHSYSYYSILRGSLDIAGSSFSENSSSTGGAVWTNLPMQIQNSTIADNTASGAGGGIFGSSTELSITDSTIEDNRSKRYGGGISVRSGTLEISGSTLSGNSAVREGGAIENGSAAVSIANTTISGNSSDHVAGGIYNYGLLELTNSTVTGNRADADGDGSGGGGGLYHAYSSWFPSPLLNNTLLAGNVVGPAGADSPDDVFGSVRPASSHNLIGDAATAGVLADGVNGNIVGNAGSGTIDITTVLDPNLADNGGLTLTHALVPGGLAVDAGDNGKAVDADGDPLVDDQRGTTFPRVVFGVVDIGAFEVQVQIDVKPGSQPNSINLASNGRIAVAIFTTEDFDASQVDASTVVFAGANAVRSSLEDLDHDGDLDMVLHFRLQDTELADIHAQLLADDINEDGILDSNRHTAAISLTGQTVTDEYFEAFDEVDLFLSGKHLRDLLADLAAAGTI